MEIKDKDVSVILQGSSLGKFKGKSCIEYSIPSIRKVMPNCKIILSTWEKEKNNLENQNILSLIDDIVYNKDPGFQTRDCKPEGKPNNVNRQIVSTNNGLKQAKTQYALKLRTDFVLNGKGFIKKFDIFNEYIPEYRIFNKRIICCMFGTRKPKAFHFNFPFHISDFSTFGLTEDLTNLYNIPLVTNEEFNYFKIHTEFLPDTYARNKYNAEQSIWINCLLKNQVDVKCKYSTHCNEEIANQSDLYLVNNFYPIPFSSYGIYALKSYLWERNNICDYTDYYTEYEWMSLYKKICDKSFEIPFNCDRHRKKINLCISLINNKFIPKFIKKTIIKTFINK